MAAPYGILHGRAVHPFETVELVRDLYESGTRPSKIAKMLDIPVHTIHDWVYFRTRVYG